MASVTYDTECFVMEGVVKKFLVLLLLLLAVEPCSAQIFPRIFRPRDRNYPVCPGPDCEPYSPSRPDHPPLAPSVEPENDEVLAEMEKVVPEQLRIRNRRGNCVWCAVEDVFVSAGYDQFKGITDRAVQQGWSGATWSNVEAAIRTANVDVVSTSSRDTSVFDYAKKEGLAAVVFVPGHALVRVGHDERYVYMLDNNPNDASGKLKVLRWAHSKFNSLWDGHACCPRKKKPKPDSPPVKPDVKPEVKPETKPEVKPVDCKCPPPAPSTDVKPITDALSKLAEIATLTNQSVGKLNDKVDGVDKRVGEIDKRLVAVEQKQSAPVVTSPPSPDPRLDKLTGDLDKLRDALKKGGTLNVTLVPQ